MYLQRNKISYQAICDHINSKQSDFKLFKDFFTRFRSKENYYKGRSKAEKLTRIHQYTKDFRSKNENEEEHLEKQLLTLVVEANVEEFYAYANINKHPPYDEERLNLFFSTNNPAGLVIKNNLRHKKHFNWVLSTKDHGSDYKILAIEVSNKFSEYATIETNEYWKLCWINKETKTLQFVYDSINKQTYLVARNKEGSWYIKDNIYSSNLDKRRPKYISDENVVDRIEKGERANLSALKNLLESNELGLAIAFMKRTTEQTIQKPESNALKDISAEYQENLRLLNINNRSTEIFNKTNATLKYDILKLWDRIFK